MRRGVATGNPVSIEKVWLTTESATEYLQVSRRWLEKMRKQANLSFYKVGGVVFYEKKELDRMIQRNKIV